MHEDRLGIQLANPFWCLLRSVFHPFKMVSFSSEIFFAGAISLWTWWRTMPSSVPQSGVSNLRDIQLLGRSRGGPWAVGGGSSWGRCEAKGHDAQRARHGVMVPSCSATGGRDAGMPKAADICHQFATKQPNTHCKNSNSGHASTLMKT